MVDSAFFKNMISSAKQKAHTKEVMTKLREEENINEMREFLQAEQLILDNEVKLGDVLKGMANTVDAIIEETKTVYGYGVGVSNKVRIVRSELPGKNLPEYDPELTKLLRVFAQAHEILKVLVNDHKKTENLELQYTHGMGAKKKEDAKIKDPTLSYKTFMRIIEAFTGYVGYTKNINGEEIKLHPEEFNPNVDSIIEHIREGTTHTEKRDLILNKLKATLAEIKATYDQMLQQDTLIWNKYNALLGEYEPPLRKYQKTLRAKGLYPLTKEDAKLLESKNKLTEEEKNLLKAIIFPQNMVDIINGDGTGEKGAVGLLVELDGRKQAIKKQLEVINADIIKINQALGLEENIKRGLFFTKRAVDKYKEKEKKKEKSVA